MEKKVDKKFFFRVHWHSLSSDKLLDLWLSGMPAVENVAIIEKILIDRRVITIEAEKQGE